MWCALKVGMCETRKVERVNEEDVYKTSQSSPSLTAGGLGGRRAGLRMASQRNSTSCWVSWGMDCLTGTGGERSIDSWPRTRSSYASASFAFKDCASS